MHGVEIAAVIESGNINTRAAIGQELITCDQ